MRLGPSWSSSSSSSPSHPPSCTLCKWLFYLLSNLVVSAGSWCCCSLCTCVWGMGCFFFFFVCLVVVILSRHTLAFSARFKFMVVQCSLYWHATLIEWVPLRDQQICCSAPPLWRLNWQQLTTEVRRCCNIPWAIATANSWHATRCKASSINWHLSVTEGTRVQPQVAHLLWE